MGLVSKCIEMNLRPYYPLCSLHRLSLSSNFSQKVSLPRIRGYEGVNHFAYKLKFNPNLRHQSMLKMNSPKPKAPNPAPLSSKCRCCHARRRISCDGSHQDCRKYKLLQLYPAQGVWSPPRAVPTRREFYHHDKLKLKPIWNERTELQAPSTFHPPGYVWRGFNDSRQHTGYSEYYPEESTTRMYRNEAYYNDDYHEVYNIERIHDRAPPSDHLGDDAGYHYTTQGNERAAGNTFVPTHKTSGSQKSAEPAKPIWRPAVF